MTNTIPVLLLTGYLGSGKTTLLNRILRNRRGIRFAVVVNDIGEVNIDASLIRRDGIVGADPNSPDLVALQNGCICCTLKTDLMKQIDDLCRAGKFDYIVIEASGICEPAPIAQTIDAMKAMAKPGRKAPVPVLDCIVTVVDALRLKSEFGSGEALRGADIGEDDIENLIIQQIEFCNIILLNKIDEVSETDADEIRVVIRALQPKARIINCNYGDINLDDILDTHLFDFEDVATSATWVQEIERPASAEEEHHAHGHQREHEHEHEHDCDHDHCHHHHHHDEGEAEEYGIGTFVYYRRQPFDFHRFDHLAAHWPKSIIRTKGVIYFSHNRDMSLLFEQAGVQVSVKEAGLWLATAPKDELRQMAEADPTILRDWDSEYGDRMVKLVIIGRDMDRAAITAALDSCLAR